MQCKALFLATLTSELAPKSVNQVEVFWDESETNLPESQVVYVEWMRGALVCYNSLSTFALRKLITNHSNLTSIA